MRALALGLTAQLTGSWFGVKLKVECRCGLQSQEQRGRVPERGVLGWLAGTGALPCSVCRVVGSLLLSHGNYGFTDPWLLQLNGVSSFPKLCGSNLLVL